VDDKKLLKLLTTGIGEAAAAQQLGVSIDAVAERIRAYLEAGILQCNAEREAVDWKAYGAWQKQKKALEAA